MIVAGVIAEYNPFHNGHKYQLEQIRKQTNADFIIVAMSGNFLQRGVPAIMDKYARTRLALSQGADLVIELPTIWATSSAEYFAGAGVRLLANTGVVDTLCFGAECASLTTLKTIAGLISCESSDYQKLLQESLKKGCSFPRARMQALSTILKQTQTEPISDLDMLLSSPNNILAIEYLRALKALSPQTSIQPCLIQRIGSGYHDDTLCAFASATAIRKQLLEKTQPANTAAALQNVLPEDILIQLKEYANTYGFIDDDSFSTMLGYQLYTCQQQNYASFADCSVELSNRIGHLLPEYKNFTDFCQLLKTKDLTYTRISRALLHILLQITKEQYEVGKSLSLIPYLRILGFRKDATLLLQKMKKQSSVPMITKVRKAKEQIEDNAMWMFEQDLFASNIYRQRIIANKKSVPKNDYSQELILI